ncbi:type II CAAX prenyl endopeptidase Rce1 family protein [Candidatus Poriferisodalis sp.]|uniref:CPBP family glutamic-type intramembrane protease n=1 Tax=Candidatus Poriferisodalis sp. TaxID=3101277 RepID=UPI003B016C45
MSGEGTPPADADAPEGVWSTINPRFGVRPGWRTAASRKTWPRGLALLFVIGLGGSIALLFVSLAAAQTGFESTLEDQLLSEPLLWQLISVAVVAPLFEETAFRLALTARPSLGKLALPGVLALSGVAGLVYFAPGGALIVAGFFAVIAVVAFVLWAQSAIAEIGLGDPSEPPRSYWSERAGRWWSAHPRLIIWCSIAAFGLVHLGNYDVSLSVAAVVVSPVVVSPQIWLGLMFTIARVRYGWWAGLALHTCHNLVVWSVISALD